MHLNMGQSRPQLVTVYHYSLVVIETTADDIVSAVHVELDKFVLGCAFTEYSFELQMKIHMMLSTTSTSSFKEFLALTTKELFNCVTTMFVKNWQFGIGSHHRADHNVDY